MPKTHEQFVSALETSRDAVWFVAESLHAQGWNVRILPATVAKKGESRAKHMDQGDLEIIKRLEVKHRPDMDFNSLEEFKFDSVIVDEPYKIEKYAEGTLFGYIVLNKNKTGGMFIHPNTRKHWVIEPRFDSKEGKDKDFMLCPKKFAKFITFK